jgi:hypothetical protein
VQRSGAQLPLSSFTRQVFWEPLLLRLPEVTPQGLAMMRLVETGDLHRKTGGTWRLNQGKFWFYLREMVKLPGIRVK